MSPRILSSVFLALLACAPAASASAEDSAGPMSAAKTGDFSWSGTVKKGGEIKLSNVSGNVEVVPGKGDKVRVEAKILGRDADITKVVVKDRGDSVKIHTEFGRKRNVDARVDYRIEVPAGVDFDATVVAGNITAEGINGALELEAVSGNINASGTAPALADDSAGGAAVSLPPHAARVSDPAPSATIIANVLSIECLRSDPHGCGSAKCTTLCRRSPCRSTPDLCELSHRHRTAARGGDRAGGGVARWRPR